MIDVETKTKDAHLACEGMSLCESTDNTNFTEDKDIMGTEKKHKQGYAGIHVKGKGTDFKHDLEVKNKKIIDAYDRMLAGGEKERTQYICLVYDTLENLIKDHIGMYHFSYGKTEFEDLMSSGKVAIMEKIDLYDPRKAMPSTFFGPKIDELLKKTNHQDSPMTDHYLEMLGKLNKAAREAGFEDALDPECTPALLNILTEIPITTICNTLEQAGMKTESTDDTNYKQPSGYTSSPEQLFIRNENTEFLREAVESLSPYEQFIFFKACVETEKDAKGMEKSWSVRKICQVLAEPGVMARLGLEKAPDNNRVSRDIEIARRKLIHYGNMRERFHYKPKASRDNRDAYEQAGMDEIESAILADIETL